MTMTFPFSAEFLDQLPLGFLLVDSEKRIRWANLWVQERLTIPFAPGLPLETIVAPEAQEALQQGLEHTFVNRLPTFLSHRMHRQILRLRPPPTAEPLDTTPHQVYILYFGEVEGEPTAAILVEDLTARWLAEHRLRQQLFRRRVLYNAVSALNHADTDAPQHSLEALRELWPNEPMALYLLEEGHPQAQLKVALGVVETPLPPTPPENSLVQWVLQAKRPLIWRLKDAQLPQRELRPLLPHSQNAVAVPVGTPEVLLGALALESAQEDAFGERDLELLQSVAHHLALHLQWQRSYERERRLRRLADTLRETGLQLTTTLDSDRIQDLILRFVKEVVPYDSACILLLRPDGKVVVSRHQGYDRFGISDETMRSLVIDLDTLANLQRMARTHQPLVIPNTTQDAHWKILPTSRHIKSWVGAPIVTRERLVGFLVLDHTQPGFYTAEHAQALALFANQAALALENAWLYEQRYQEAITDPLTGLANRRYFQSQLEREVARAKRFGRPLSLLMIDLDDFKRYNDTFGHPAGDEALKRVAQVLEANTRQIDLTARYGGEEFAAILPETSSAEALKVAQRIIQAVRTLHQTPTAPLRAPLSV